MKVQSVLGAPKLKIADSDPANIECVIRAGGLRVVVVAEASPRAWTQFDTVVSHAAQAFAPAGASQSQNLPRDLPGLGYNAAWIAAGRQLVATNGTQSRGGSFVTVTLAGRNRTGTAQLRIAVLCATAALSRAPRGPSPGPAPS